MEDRRFKNVMRAPVGNNQAVGGMQPTKKGSYLAMPSQSLSDNQRSCNIVCPLSVEGSLSRWVQLETYDLTVSTTVARNQTDHVMLSGNVEKKAMGQLAHGLGGEKWSGLNAIDGIGTALEGCSTGTALRSYNCTCGYFTGYQGLSGQPSPGSPRTGRGLRRKTSVGMVVTVYCVAVFSPSLAIQLGPVKNPGPAVNGEVIHAVNDVGDAVETQIVRVGKMEEGTGNGGWCCAYSRHMEHRFIADITLDPDDPDTAPTFKRRKQDIVHNPAISAAKKGVVERSPLSCEDEGHSNPRERDELQHRCVLLTPITRAPYSTVPTAQRAEVQGKHDAAHGAPLHSSMRVRLCASRRTAPQMRASNHIETERTSGVQFGLKGTHNNWYGPSSTNASLREKKRTKMAKDFGDNENKLFHIAQPSCQPQHSFNYRLRLVAARAETLSARTTIARQSCRIERRKASIYTHQRLAHPESDGALPMVGISQKNTRSKMILTMRLRSSSIRLDRRTEIQAQPPAYIYAPLFEPPTTSYAANVHIRTYIRTDIRAAPRE
ncbi:hypothetical protein V8E53_005813 [Lactarius tabidus]